MFERIKKNVLRDMQTAIETRYTDGPRDALLHNFLLVEVCDRLGKLSEVMHTVGQEVRNARVDRIREMQAPTYYHLQEDQHDGIMIAFYVDESTAHALALPGGEAPGQLHVTLCYLGSKNRYPDVLEELKRIVGQFAATHDAISGQIGGIAFFDPSEHSDNLMPVVALTNVAGLQEFRRKLAELLDNAGVMIANDYDFLPHITLAYVDPDKPLPLHHLPSPAPLTFDTLWLCIGDERISYKLGESHEPTNTQSATTTHEEESEAEVREIHEGDRISGSTNRSEGDTDTGDSAINENGNTSLDIHTLSEDGRQSGRDRGEARSGRRNESTGTEISHGVATDKVALAAAMTNEIVHYKAGQPFSEHIIDALATAYLDAQRYAYNKAMQTVGIKVAQEGIIGNIATGVKAFTFALALEWARKQVVSIVSTLQEALSNFVSKLGDIEIDAQVEQFLSDYAAWKAPQIANVAWSSGADVGTNAAIGDILEAATNPELPGLAIDNMRVKVLPSESSSDACKEYAGKSWSLMEYQALGVSWPMHPECPHYAEIYIDNGSDTGDEML